MLFSLRNAQIGARQFQTAKDGQEELLMVIATLSLQHSIMGPMMRAMSGFLALDVMHPQVYPLEGSVSKNSKSSMFRDLH